MDKVRTSKALSFWLRHKPEAAGLSLTSDGWADVDAVLAAFAAEGQACSWEHLLDVVETNDKQRFELSADAARIRARQGHSIDINVGWPECEPPPYLWHGTVERFLDPILAEGLKPMARHHVHLSADLETARRVGARRGAPVLLKIDAKALWADGRRFFLSSNGVWLTDHVPPAALAVEQAV